MHFSIKAFALGMLSMASAAATPATYPTPRPGCGQVDVIFTGLPPFHPLVTAQGFDPNQVNGALRADAANVIAAGYNLRVALFGPEQGVGVLRQSMNGINWDVTGVGYGVRGSRVPNLTLQFTDIIQTYRERAILAPIVFNYSPNTTLWALQQKIPLSSNCTNSPGKNLGIQIYCDPSVCPQQ